MAFICGSGFEFAAWADPGPEDPRLRRFMDRRWGGKGRGPVYPGESLRPPGDAADPPLTDAQSRIFAAALTREEFDRLLENGSEDDDALVLRGLELGHLDPDDCQGMLSDPALLATRWVATRDRTLLRALPWIPAGDALARAIASGGIADAASLMDLAACGDRRVALALARSPQADARLLDEIARSDGRLPLARPASQDGDSALDDYPVPHRSGPRADEDPLVVVLAHPATSPATIAWLRRHGPRHIRVTLLTDPDCPSPQSYVHDPDPLIRCLAYLHPQTPERIAWRVAWDQDFWVRAAAASHPSASPTMLEALARDSAIDVLRALAANPHATARALADLDLSRDELLRRAVASNRHTPAAILLTLSQDPDPFTRAAAGANPSTPADGLIHVYEASTGHASRIALAGNAATPPAILQELAHSVNAEIRTTAQRTLDAPIEPPAATTPWPPTRPGRHQPTRHDNAPHPVRKLGHHEWQSPFRNDHDYPLPPKPRRSYFDADPENPN